jgi:hypothetical protein
MAIGGNMKTWVILFLVLTLPAAAQQRYPSYIRDRTISDCMTQKPPVAVPYTDSQKRAYCTCYSNYFQQYVSYTDFEKADQLARAGRIKEIPMSFAMHVEKAVNACGQRFLLNKQ